MTEDTRKPQEILRISKKAPYEILGIDELATHAEAVHAYRKLARKYHPDRNAGDKLAEDVFKHVSGAWEQVEPVFLQKDKNAKPLVPVGASLNDIEDASGAFLLDDTQEVQRSTRPSRGSPPSPPKPPAGKNTWETVASESGRSGTLIPHEQTERRSWGKYTASKKVTGTGLLTIHPEEAAQLIFGRPNAFHALKTIQRMNPELCLYDAILSKAHGISSPLYQSVAAKPSNSTAIAIYGADQVDKAACDMALRDPMASVQEAMNELKAGRLSVPDVAPQKLGLDLAFLKEHIDELLKKCATRRYTPPGGWGGEIALS